MARQLFAAFECNGKNRNKHKVIHKKIWQLNFTENHKVLEFTIHTVYNVNTKLNKDVIGCGWDEEYKFLMEFNFV